VIVSARANARIDQLHRAAQVLMLSEFATDAEWRRIVATLNPLLTKYAAQLEEAIATPTAVH
jgi:hypothetical protein